MFHRRRAFVRLASVAAGASCLALAACGSSASSSGAPGATAASATADPLASLSANKVMAEVLADAKAASSLTLDGTISDSNGNQTVRIAIKPGKGCTGTVAIAGRGSFKLILIGDTVYLNPDKQFWEANGGANATEVIALVDGRYIKVSTSDKAMGSLATICDVNQMFSSSGEKDKVTKGKVTTLDGSRVLALKDTSDGSLAYVTDISKPQLLEMTSPKGGKNGTGKITVTYGAPVTLTAPAASQVLDGAQLGF